MNLLEAERWTKKVETAFGVGVAVGVVLGGIGVWLIHLFP